MAIVDEPWTWGVKKVVDFKSAFPPAEPPSSVPVHQVGSWQWDHSQQRWIWGSDPTASGIHLIWSAALAKWEICCIS